MRGVVFTGERGLELMSFPDPTPDAHEVVIEMKASGVCGSDLHQLVGRISERVIRLFNNAAQYASLFAPCAPHVIPSLRTHRSPPCRLPSPEERSRHAHRDEMTNMANRKPLVTNPCFTD